MKIIYIVRHNQILIKKSQKVIEIIIILNFYQVIIQIQKIKLIVILIAIVIIVIIILIIIAIKISK